MPAADLAPLESQRASQHTRTGEGELQVQPIETSHDREVSRGYRTGKIVHNAAAELQNLCLFRDRKIVFTVDHRFALSHPALVSAPSKNRSPASAPRAWRAATSRQSLAWPGPRYENLALLSSCDFQVVIWLGWMSKCATSWAIVRSPLMAASATLALKAGEWFRRGRLLVVSPVHGDYRRIQAETPLIVFQISGTGSSRKQKRSLIANTSVVYGNREMVPL
jgi:hypothetical protein